jgi:probable rRNA maturation factor
MTVRVEVSIAAGAPTGVTAATIRALVAHVAAAEGMRENGAVSVAIVDDATIRALHATHMAIDETTDVLTFALDDDDGFIAAERAPLLGEVVVSHETAAAQAGEAGHAPAREVAFLVVHGLLHLLGYDDQTPAGRAAMLRRQEALLVAFERRAVPGA